MIDLYYKKWDFLILIGKKCNQVNSFVNSFRLDLILLPAMREKFNWAWSLTNEALCIIFPHMY